MVNGTDAQDEPTQQGQEDSRGDEKGSGSVPSSAPVKGDDGVVPHTPAVLGPAGKPDKITHTVQLDLLNVTRDFLVEIVTVMENGSQNGAHAMVHWKDGSNSSIIPKGLSPEMLQSIEQVDQIGGITGGAIYPDGSHLSLMIHARIQELRSTGDIENSEAQQRLYRIRNMAQATDIPRNSSLPRVYRHRLAAIITLVGVSLSASILALISTLVLDSQPIVTWSLITAQCAAFGGVILLRKRWPLERPAPDAVVLRHSDGDKRQSESWITYTTLVATVVAGIAAVIQLFI